MKRIIFNALEVVVAVESPVECPMRHFGDEACVEQPSCMQEGDRSLIAFGSAGNGSA